MLLLPLRGHHHALHLAGRQTRECPFDKLVAVQHDDSSGTTTISLSNRQKPVTIHYGAKLNGWVRLRVDLAVAHARNQVPALVERLQQGLAAIDAERPTPPSTPAAP